MIRGATPDSRGDRGAGRSAALAAVAVAVVALTACASEGTGPEARGTPPPSPASPPAPSPQPSATTGTASPEPSATAGTTSPERSATTGSSPDVVSPDAVVYFTSPSRNISCQMTGTASTCDIREHTYALPPRPEGCELDHGDMISVEAQRPASFLCHGDTNYDPSARVLDYGEELSNGRFTCASDESGMSCSTASGDHGFELSRARHRLF